LKKKKKTITYVEFEKNDPFEPQSAMFSPLLQNPKTEADPITGGGGGNEFVKVNQYVWKMDWKSVIIITLFVGVIAIGGNLLLLAFTILVHTNVIPSLSPFLSSIFLNWLFLFFIGILKEFLLLFPALLLLQIRGFWESGIGEIIIYIIILFYLIASLIFGILGILGIPNIIWMYHYLFFSTVVLILSWLVGLLLNIWVISPKTTTRIYRWARNNILYIILFLLILALMLAFIWLAAPDPIKNPARFIVLGISEIGLVLVFLLFFFLYFRKRRIFKRTIVVSASKASQSTKEFIMVTKICR